jgi:type IV secretory pathway VirB10-like protein
MPDTVRIAEPSKEVEHIQDPEAETIDQGVGPKRPFVLEKRRGTGAGNMALMLTVVGVIVMFGICTVAFLSSKGGVKRKSREESAKPSLGRPLVSSASGDLIPNDKVKPSPDQTTQNGVVHASDIERTKSRKPSQSQTNNGEESSSSGKPLSKVTKFEEPDTNPSSTGNWSPPPYGSRHEADQRSEKKEDEAYSKPSIVFIAHHQPTVRNEQGTTTRTSDNFGLAPGYHVAARLESMATTAVHAPVTAIVEYNYERNGQTLIAAGSRVVGKISQADPTGMVNMTFSSIEFPDGETVPIEAVAADMNLQALKGQVTGKQHGKSMLVRSLSGIGETAAMVVGAPSANSAFSESELIRMRLADNVGNASDEQIMKMMAMEHIVVSVPAGTEFYVIFEKLAAKNGSAGAKSIQLGGQDAFSDLELSRTHPQVERP